MPQSAILTPKPFYPIVIATCITEQLANNNAWTVLPLSTKFLDIFNSWNTNTFVFTVPKSGVYRFLIWSRSIITGTPSGSTDIVVGMSINNSVEIHVQRSYHAVTLGAPSVNGVVPSYPLSQGDLVSIKAYYSIGGSPIIRLQPYHNQICIELMS